MKYVALLYLALCAAGATAVADDQVRLLQEQLRKRNLYFGEIDGRKNEEVAGAIKRYQQRKGLPPTGEMTPTTLSSLGIAAVVKPGEEWPEGPVLKSDFARNISEEDRKFLEATSPTAPDPIAEGPVPAPEVSPAAPPVVIAPEASPAAPPIVIAPESGPPRKPASVPPGPKPGPTEDAAGPARFVQTYLAACETNRVAEEMRFYGPRVSYFDHGLVESPFIEKDVERFYKRWPHRRYELLDCKVTPVNESEWEARFRIGFHYTNDRGQRASGRSLNIFKIQKKGEGMQFVSMKEQVVRE